MTSPAQMEGGEGTKSRVMKRKTGVGRMLKLKIFAKIGLT
jgi:hypothetical protein